MREENRKESGGLVDGVTGHVCVDVSPSGGAESGDTELEPEERLKSGGEEIWRG